MKPQKAFNINILKISIMRKKIFGAAVIAALAGVSVYNFSLNQTVDEFSDLTLENLDAIATARGNFPACQKRKEQVLRLLFLFVLMEYVNSHIKREVR